MSEKQQKDEGRDEIRLTVTPQPSDEELLAILQALQALDPDDQEPVQHDGNRSVWQEVSRNKGVRARNWPAQVRSWVNPRH